MKEARLKTIKEYEDLWVDYTVAKQISSLVLVGKILQKIKDKEAKMLNDNFTEDDLDNIILKLKTRMESE